MNPQIDTIRAMSEEAVKSSRVSQPELVELLGITDKDGITDVSVLRGALITVWTLQQKGVDVTQLRPKTMPAADELITVRQHNRELNLERERLYNMAIEAKQRYSWCGVADSVIENVGLDVRDPEYVGMSAEIVLRIPITFQPQSETVINAISVSNWEQAEMYAARFVDKIQGVQVRSERPDSGLQMTASVQLSSMWGRAEDGTVMLHDQPVTMTVENISVNED